MSNEDEVKALTEELELLRAEAEPDQGGPQTANSARQQEIIKKLADLGVQLG